MIMLLPITFLVVSAQLRAASVEEQPSITRIIDVRSALPLIDCPEHRLVLLPLSRDYEQAYPTSNAESPGKDPGSVVSFLRGLDPAQWEYEGRDLLLLDDLRLRVVAPQALQDVAARALAFMEETVGRPTTVVIDLVAFGPNPGIATLPPILPASEVARWTGIGTGHESYELTLRPGETSMLRAERSVSFALGGDPEIAERSAAFTILPERVSVGTAIDFRLTPAKSGVYVAFAFRNGRFLDTDTMHEEALHKSTSHDQGTVNENMQKTRSDPRLANHSLAVNAFIPEGKALAFVTSAGLESRVLFVRQLGATPPTSVSLPDDLKRVTSRNATVLARTDSINLPTVGISNAAGESRLPRSFDGLCAPHGGDAEPQVLASISQHRIVEPLDYLRTFTDEYEVLELGAFVALLGANREGIDKALARIAQASPEPQALAVTLTLRRGTRDAPVLARAVLPMRAGATSTAILGRESVADLSVAAQIAGSASATYTYVGRLFDGLVVSITPSPTLAGGLALALDVHARWARAQPRDYDAGGPTTPRIQLPDADLLDVARSITFAKADGGARKVTLGNAGTSGEALTLDIEVVDLR